MKRLTKRINGYAHGAEGVSADRLTGNYCRGEFEATACVEKLAEYEDFEEIFRSKMTDFVCDFLKDKEEFTRWLERNKWITKKCDEYARAEEQGKLLKLPCAVGDTVYQHMLIGINKVKRKPIYGIFKATVFKFSLSSCSLCFWTETTDDKKCQNEITVSAFGKTVFLTREEAEVALKKL